MRHPCPLEGERHMACMKNITVDIVMKYAHELLEKYGDMAGNIPRVYGAYECKVIDMAKGES